MNVKIAKLDGNVLYFQSGGPTAVINSSFLGLFNEYKKLNDTKNRFFISHYGIEGIINDDLFDVSKRKISDFKLEYRPGAFFGSARKKIPEDKRDPLAQKIIKTIKEKNIRYIFPNGGNDSMNTCLRLNEYFKDEDYSCNIIGVPKTIDNDLNIGDHTPGFGSAAKYIINSVMAIKIDDLSYAKGRINIVEVMGRDNGSLAASSIAAKVKGLGPDFIYLPEVPFDKDAFVKETTEFYLKNKHCLIVVSEGIKDKDGNLISSIASIDQFGNTQLGGVGLYLTSLFSEAGIKTRAIELSTIQRAASFIPSLTDIKEAKKCGAFAFKNALNGTSNKMVAIKRISNNPYKIKLFLADIDKVATTACCLPSCYIDKEKHTIKDSFIEYVLPLIKGEGKDVFLDGLMNI